MNGLPGNPHEEDAMNYSCEAADINSWATAEERIVLAQQATAHAVLALAYEQRTANLIALAQISIAPPHPDYDMEAIYQRLGMGE